VWGTEWWTGNSEAFVGPRRSEDGISSLMLQTTALSPVLGFYHRHQAVMLLGPMRRTYRLAKFVMAYQQDTRKCESPHEMSTKFSFHGLEAYCRVDLSIRVPGRIDSSSHQLTRRHARLLCYWRRSCFATPLESMRS